MISISRRLQATQGRPTGFDYLRVGLALSVILIHTASTCYGAAGVGFVWDGAFRGVAKMILPMFFALSGFLVAGSLQRSRTLGMFLGLRAIRIFPALMVETLFSACVIGAAFTTLPLGLYFRHPQFFRYLLNVTGEVSFYLPGVFKTLPDTTVNAQLWTVPFELYCYASLALLVALGIRRRASTILYFLGVCVAASLLYALHREHAHWYEIRKSVPGLALVTAFSTGVAIYLYRDRIAWNGWLALGLAALSLLLFQFARGADFFAVVPAAYVTVYLGLCSPKRSFLIRGADYSYGLYLYGFPIQQAIAASGAWARYWYVSLPLAVAFTSLFAAGSWRLVEKPALRLRRPLQAWEDRYLASRLNLLLTDAVHRIGRRLTGAGSLSRPPTRQA